MSTDRVAEYILLSAPDTAELSSMVNDYLKKGYRPHGSPMMCADPAFSNSVILAQAVVKFATNPRGFNHGRGILKIGSE